MKSRHEIKSRFLALNLALEYTDIKEYHKSNPDSISEMISHTSEALVIGKYVMSYFEGFLRRLWTAVGEKADLWYGFWTDEYLSALKSSDEALRAAACTHITPIVIKINKQSLAYILSKFLDSSKSISHENTSSLESLMTLLKVARQNKMICISDKTQDIRLEGSAQAALFEL
jgi:hypothetical protein